MPQAAKALILTGVNEQMLLEDVFMDDPQEGEVLIRMIASGVCHSDLSVVNGVIANGVWPCILGHEGVGEVVQLGTNVSSFKTGDCVLLSFDYCGTCKQCINPKASTASCKQWYPRNLFMERPDGSTKSAFSDHRPSIGARFFGQSSFSTYSLASVNSCIKLPEAVIDPTFFAPLGCGVQTGAGAVLNVLKPDKTQTIAVWGMGGVGISALCAAKYLGLQTIIAVDIVPSRLQLAQELGATHVINSKEVDALVRILEITNGDGLDFAVEATGLSPCITAAYESLGGYGTHAQLGATPPGMQLTLDLNKGQVLQKRFISILEGDSDTPTFIPRLVEMQLAGHLPIDKIAKTFKFADFQTAFNAMKDGSVIKPILVFD